MPDAAGSAVEDPLAAQARARPDAVALEVHGPVDAHRPGDAGDPGSPDHPDDTDDTDGTERWSYAQLDAAVRTLAERLAGARIGPGARVATLLGPGRDIVTALYAVPRTGAAVAPLDPRLTDRELVQRLDLLRPAMVLCHAATEKRAATVVQAAAIVTLDERSTGTRALPIASLPSASPSPGRSSTGSSSPGPSSHSSNAPHTIVLTSGTAGRPRGVPLTLTNHLHHARASAERLGLGPDDRWLASLSPAHIGGLAMVVRAAVTGARLVATPGWHADRFLALADAGAVTHASLVPAMLDQVLEAGGDRQAPEPLEAILLGGAATPRPLMERALARGYPIALTYGLSEAASQVATAPPGLTAEKPGTVGAPLRGVEVRLGSDGEILVRGPTVMRGYVGVDEPGVDDEGWLHTGDVGRFDDDGHLWVLGRLDDRIVAGGVNVDPAEVEAVLMEHPGVRAAAAVGVDHPRWGHVVAAVIVPTRSARAGSLGADGPDALDADALDADTLAAAWREHLSSAQRPRRIVFVDELPRNANGKVDRAALRALVERSAPGRKP